MKTAPKRPGPAPLSSAPTNATNQARHGDPSAPDAKRARPTLPSGNDGQLLSGAEVVAFKQTGASLGEVADYLASNNTSFAGMNSMQQEKYLRRKARKHSNVFSVKKADAKALLEFYSHKGAIKVMGMRQDTLALMATLADIRPGARVLVCDSVHGVVAAAVAERLAGRGQVLQAFLGQAPANTSLPAILGKNIALVAQVALPYIYFSFFISFFLMHN